MRKLDRYLLYACSAGMVFCAGELAGGYHGAGGEGFPWIAIAVAVGAIAVGFFSLEGNDGQ